MNAGFWFSLLLAGLKLAGALVDEARATRQAGESASAALGRILDDALQTLELAKKARADALARDTAADGLRHADGWQRD